MSNKTINDKKTLSEALKDWKEHQRQLNPSGFKEMNITSPRSWNDIIRIKYKLMDTFKPTQTILINMELDNGFHVQFVIPVKNGHFEYMGGVYVIDDSLKYFNMSSKLWALDYHQSLSFPVRRKISVNEVTNNIRDMEDIDVDEAINPRSLKGWLKSTIVQKVMEGAEMADVFKFLKTMSVLILICSAVTALIMIQSTGALSSLGF